MLMRNPFHVHQMNISTMIVMIVNVVQLELMLIAVGLFVIQWTNLFEWSHQKTVKMMTNGPTVAMTASASVSQKKCYSISNITINCFISRGEFRLLKKNVFKGVGASTCRCHHHRESISWCLRANFIVDKRLYFPIKLNQNRK